MSGGMDSAVTLYMAMRRGYKVHCMIFDYGQRHKKEIYYAKRLARHAGCDYIVLKIKLPWRKSALLDKDLPIPDRKRLRGIPITYVPGRNTIFLSFAISYAEATNSKVIFIGANAIDFSGYPDCRPIYFKRFNNLVKEAIKARNIRIEAPLLYKSKKEIVRLGKKLGVPFEMTWSCYRGGKLPCGRCDACRLRQLGFERSEAK